MRIPSPRNHNNYLNNNVVIIVVFELFHECIIILFITFSHDHHDNKLLANVIACLCCDCAVNIECIIQRVKFVAQPSSLQEDFEGPTFFVLDSQDALQCEHHFASCSAEIGTPTATARVTTSRAHDSTSSVAAGANKRARAGDGAPAAAAESLGAHEGVAWCTLICLKRT